MNEQPKLKRDWLGRYVRVRYDMQNNGGYQFKAGTVMKVIKNHMGLDLVIPIDCPHCHSQRYRVISRVHEYDVELLPIDYVPVAAHDVLSDLLAACEAIVVHVADLHSWPGDVEAKLQAAIAKARGEVTP